MNIDNSENSSPGGTGNSLGKWFNNQPLFKEWWFWLTAVVVLLAIIGIAGSSSDSRSSDKPISHRAEAHSTTTKVAAVPTTKPQVTTPPITAPPATAPPTTAAPSFTNQQRNAIEEARQYLDTSAFSRQGLIDQLSSQYGSGYSVEDATVAVDSLGVDWNAQAAQSAKDYLSMSPFSCNALIEQLSSAYGEKFSVDQATYGAQQAGAC